jgi:hypothetical protein
MKKEAIPKIKDTSANINGIKESISRKKGIMKNKIETIINTSPTAKEYVLFNIQTN